VYIHIYIYIYTYIYIYMHTYIYMYTYTGACRMCNNPSPKHMARIRYNFWKSDLQSFYTVDLVAS